MSSSCGGPGPTSSNYDVTADGKRFLMVKDDDQDYATSKQIVVVLGWVDELRRRSGLKLHAGLAISDSASGPAAPLLRAPCRTLVAGAVPPRGNPDDS
ncbi:MAG: hypothetical protein LAQ69_14410 [Acidobacteriia bacterium]|nr:hypothetical protein [Terriglobia bacterium]